ncbi:MAG: DNA primase [Planctomycetota bacterium]|nr:DNA primase [Planctomycetota bacterium]
MGDRSDVDRVKEATNLVELIGTHVALEPKGREHIGLCPFHDDKTPSFCVVTHKSQSFYKCHSCGASGDAFTFLQNYLRIDFREALTMLADKAGITLSTKRPSPEDKERRSNRERVTAANRFAGDFFRRSLGHPEHGRLARQVIETRGITEEMVEAFMIGCAPAGWDTFLGTLGNRPETIESARMAGLLRERTNGPGNYDYFRNRLIFPICDESGSPIAFGGRILDPEDNPKYLNSPETELFQKGRTLYGLHLARKPIMDRKVAIVTEGYTDVIACHQGGFRNAVGTLGTAMTDDHARILSRIANTVILLFDGDEAGQRAAERAMEVMINHPVDVFICILPDGQDPADMLAAERGPERFQAAIDDCVTVLDYMLDRFRRDFADQKTMAGRQEAIESFIGTLARLGLARTQPIRRAMIINQVSELTDMPSGVIESMLAEADTVARSRPTGPAAPPAQAPDPSPEDVEGMFESHLPAVSNRRRLAEQEYLAVLLFDDEAPHREGHELLKLECFLDERNRALAHEVLTRIARGGSTTIHDLHREVSDERIHELASNLWFKGQRLVDEPADDYDQRSPLQRVTEAFEACMNHAHAQQRLAQIDVSESNPGALMEALRTIREQGPNAAAIHRNARN